MGDREFINQAEYQQFPGSGNSVYLPFDYLWLFVRKRTEGMATTKVILWCLYYILGVPFLGVTFYLNWNTWKSDVMFVLLVVSLLVRLYYGVKKRSQDIRMRELQIEEKEMRVEARREEFEAHHEQ